MNVNREFIARWADTLESGEFPQTRGRLHRSAPTEDGVPAGYCCIGVACVVAGIEPVMGRSGYWFDNQSVSVPYVLVDLAGKDVKWADLEKRNDGMDNYHPHSFVEIAAHLRATYLNETEEAS